MRHGSYFFETIKKAKRDSQLDYFMDVFSIVAWEIWKQGNTKIFRSIMCHRYTLGGPEPKWRGRRRRRRWPHHKGRDTILEYL
jgi:hypothetical protein